jgi:hypothetical protein
MAFATVDGLSREAKMVVRKLRRSAAVTFEAGVRDRGPQKTRVFAEMRAVARGAAIVVFCRWVDSLCGQLVSNSLVASDAERTYRRQKKGLIDTGVGLVTARTVVHSRWMEGARSRRCGRYIVTVSTKSANRC